MSRDARVDAYLEKSPDFARPILAHLREVMLSVDPGITESIKWSMPAFLWNGQQIANMAAFKAHILFGFWHRGADAKPDGQKSALGGFGKIAKISDLPANDQIIAMARDAIARVDEGAKAPRVPRHERPEILMPNDFAQSLAAIPGARAMFDSFPPGARGEYLEWIVDAKQASTRARRIAQASEWIAEGKRRHWKYQER